MIDVKELLRELREEPYEKIVIRAPHSGKVEFVASEPGVRVVGPGGTWKEVPGTLLARLEGDRTNVQGLPMLTVVRMLREAGFSFFEPRAS